MDSYLFDALNPKTENVMYSKILNFYTIFENEKIH